MDSSDFSLNNSVSRRFLMAGAVGMSAAAAMGHSIAASAKSTPAIGDEDLTATFVKLNGRADGKPAYWVTRGVRYLWTGSREPVPLYHVDTITVPKFTARGNGEYEAAILENSYATDLTTGKIITTFLNPLTGKEEPFVAAALLSGKYTLTAKGENIKEDAAGDKVTGVQSTRGGIRFMRGFPGEIVIEERSNSSFGSENGIPHYADLVAQFRTESSKLDKTGVSYKKVTKTFVISRHWPHGGAETVYAPQIVGIYHGRKYLTSEEAYAIPGVKETDVLTPGTLKQMAEF